MAAGVSRLSVATVVPALPASPWRLWAKARASESSVNSALAGVREGERRTSESLIVNSSSRRNVIGSVVVHGATGQVSLRAHTPAG